MPENEKLLEYYIAKSDERLDRLESKVDKLISFRVMLVGAAVAVSGLVSVGFQIVMAWRIR